MGIGKRIYANKKGVETRVGFRRKITPFATFLPVDSADLTISWRKKNFSFAGACYFLIKIYLCVRFSKMAR
jgi:hypothetical protein